MKGSLRMALFALLAFLLGSWGFLAHRTINQLAIYELPASLQPFFYLHKDYLVKNSVRPDLRRSDDSTEATKHFIDLEMYGDSAAWKMPFSWEEAVSKYSRDSLLKYGYVPYYVIVMKDRLTGAFRRKDADSIIFYAADLGHYIADAHVPLHTTTNYDGQLTGQAGMHALWESIIPELDLDAYVLSSRHRAQYLQNPEAAIWQAVREASALLPEMFSAEKELSASFPDSLKYHVQMRRGRESKSYSSAFARAYAEKLGNTINRQMIRSADMLADFWYSSWKDAGEPDLSDLCKNLTKARKKQCRLEDRAFRHNRLLEKGWLLSRQNRENNAQR